MTHATNVASDGFVECGMNFACLQTALQRNLALFRMEASPPVPLPADAAALPLETGTLYLNSIASSAQNGIGYIQASFVGCSLDQKKRAAETRSQRSFSGKQQVLRINTTGNANPQLINVPITFDYTAQAFTVVWSAIQEVPPPKLEPKILEIRNFEGGETLLQSDSSYTVNASDTPYKLKLIEDLQIVPVGPVKRYALTVTATAESAVDQFNRASA